MNIAHVVPYSVQYPLTKPNGRYDFVRQLAANQVQQGHTVTIYGHPLSDLSIDGIMTLGIDSADAGAENKYNNNLATFELAIEQKHDIYHSHFDTLHFDVRNPRHFPIIYTQHWWPSAELIEKANLGDKTILAVPPTRFMFQFNQKHHIPSTNFIHHGIDLLRFRPARKPRSNRLLIVGRISPEKNVSKAIDIALKSGACLDIVGGYKTNNQDYFNTLSDKIDGSQIRYLGVQSGDNLIGLYQEAKAMLFPAYEHEPFGLVIIEAQACGTPVITEKLGARSELVADGKTGFLCSSDEEYLTAINSVDNLDPDAPRSFAETFDHQSMAVRYEQLYAKLCHVNTSYGEGSSNKRLT